MDTITYSIFKPLVWILVKVLYRPTVIGKENIPKEGAYVLAGNHTKWIDPPTLVALNKKQVHFLAKEEMWHNICLIVVKAMGCIPVNRKIHDHDALEAAYKCLNSGSSIGIFPEGTINRTDKNIPINIPSNYINLEAIYRLNNSTKDELNPYGGIVLKKHL